MNLLNLDNNNNLGGNSSKIEFDQDDVKKVSAAGTAFYAIAVITFLAALATFLFFVNNLDQQSTIMLGTSVLLGIIFTVMGYFTSKFKLWALLIGLVLYGLDTIFFVMQIINSQKLSYSFALRFLIIFYLIRGLLALLRLRETEANHLSHQI